jgi:probable rRNA maturation factor
MGVRDIYVELAIMDDAHITKLNRQLTGRHSITDCLSLDLSDASDRFRTIQIMVNAQQAHRQARIRGIRPVNELALYIVHGLLHQFGYDDTRADQARLMHQAEDQILQTLGYGKVYYTGPKACS